MAGKKCAGCQAEMDQDAIFCNECGMAFLDSVSQKATFPNTVAPPAAKMAVADATAQMPVPDHVPSPDAPVYSAKTCPNCGNQTVETFKFCPKCAYDFDRPVQTVINPPVTPSFLSADNGQNAAMFSPLLVLAVKKRYRDGYLQARAINGFGAFIKGLGLFIGIVICLVGLVVGGALEQSSRNSMFSGPGAGAGLLAGFAFVVYAAIITGIFWVVGVLVKAGGQMLKAQLDGAVHTSPFLTDLDRAEMMSLPTGGYGRQAYDSIPVGVANPPSVPITSPMLPNVKASLAYGASFILGILWLPVPIYILATTPVEQRFVRFHAFQAILLTVVMLIFGIVASFLLASLFGQSVSLAMLLILISIAPSLFCIAKAYNNEEFKIPIIGDFAMDYAQKGESTSIAS